MMDYPLLSLDTRTELLTPNDVFSEFKQLRDITADANARFFRGIPDGTQIDTKHACIVGKQGCGKSVMENFRLWKAYELYGRDNVNAIYTNDPRVCYDLLDGRPVQYIILDDATSYASSREIYKQTDILKIYNRGRHVYAKHRGNNPGLLLYDWCWQRWIELDPGFRDGHLMLFKTGMTGKQDKLDLIDKLGDYGARILDMIWDRIDRGDNRIKNLSVGRIASMRPEYGGVGIYRSAMVENVLPEMITSEEYFGTEEANVSILEDLRKKSPWDRRIDAYELYITKEYTQAEIADILSEKYGVKVRQGTVSEDVALVRKKLSGK